MRSVNFLFESQNKVDDLSVVWSQNHWDSFLRFNLKTGGDSFLVKPQNQGDGWFHGLTLKTGSYDLVICASKLSRRFLGLDLKIKQVSVCQLHHKTDGRVMV
jgi:hypothetical protein